MKKIFLFLALMCATGAARAQEVTTAAPASVVVGKPFTVEYRTTLSSGRLKDPTFENFEVRGNGFSMMSDNMAGNMSVYTFILVATKPGMLTIPGATIVAGGKSYTSRAVPIEVMGSGAPSTQQQSQHQTTAPASRQSAEIFLRAVPDRTSAWRGEPVRVIFKLYSRTSDISGVQLSKMPQLNGFWSESLPIDHYRPQTENYNSAVYYTWIVGEYLLFPLQAGRLAIDPMSMEVSVQQVHEREQTLEEFMLGGGMPDVTTSNHTATSTPMTITVRELPTGAPSSFGGAVGNFSMTAEPPQGDLMSNATATYRLKIAGTGNFRQITAPALTLPDSFETLNIKTIDETRAVARGVAGSKLFEYPIIARGEGVFRIDPVEFSYFDPERGAYQTLSVPEVRLIVVADTLATAATPVVGAVSQKDLEVLNRDIRFIKYDAPGLHHHGRLFVQSVWFFAIAGVLIAGFIMARRFLGRYLAQRRDARQMKVKRAGKVVRARLRIAEEHMQQGNERRFHDEMLKALWGYMADKLNIPAANLTKENVREQLLRRNVPADLAARYTDLISDCETAQYSLAESAPMSEVYAAAADTIGKMERYFR